MKRRWTWMLLLWMAVFFEPPKLWAKDELYKELKPLVESLALIQAHYVDEEKTKPKDLLEGAIKGMVATLDPFSQYLSAEESKNMQQETSGVFGGLGIEISIKNRQLTVISPIEDTPAEKAGIQAGDVIIKINGESADGIQLADAVRKLRGEPGTKVTITVFRSGFIQPRDIVITRAVIKIRQVKQNLLEGKVGYIRLIQFMGKSAEEFSKAMQSLLEKGAKDFIVDLRNNPGGLLDVASEIASYFVPKGKLIVSTEGRYQNKNLRFESRGGRPFQGNLVVLINGGSASASEIFSGAIQDQGLGILIGSKTFGKGSVQTILPLSGGASLRLTTSKYMTPNGRAIHGQGITPDIEVEDELPGRAYLEIADAGWFESFVKDYLVQYPGFHLKPSEIEKQPVKVSESSWEHLKPESRENKLLKDFFDYIRLRGSKLFESDLAEGRLRLLSRLEEEITRLQKGEDEARVVALAADPVIRRALDALKVTKLSRGRAKRADAQ